MLTKLIKLADRLDQIGLKKEVAVIDSILATRTKRSLEGLLAVANSLDARGLHKEANYLDGIIKESSYAAPFTPDRFRFGYDQDSDKVVDISDENLELESERSRLLKNLKDRLKEKHGDEKAEEEYIKIIEMIVDADSLKGEIDKIKEITLEKESYEIINGIIRLSNHLDKKGLHKEADYLDNIIKTAQQSGDQPEIEGPPTFKDIVKKDRQKANDSATEAHDQKMVRNFNAFKSAYRKLVSEVAKESDTGRERYDSIGDYYDAHLGTLLDRIDQEIDKAFQGVENSGDDRSYFNIRFVDHLNGNIAYFNVEDLPIEPDSLDSEFTVFYVMGAEDSDMAPIQPMSLNLKQVEERLLSAHG